jgi:hypothetical protein
MLKKNKEDNNDINIYGVNNNSSSSSSSFLPLIINNNTFSELICPLLLLRIYQDMKNDRNCGYNEIISQANPNLYG